MSLIAADDCLELWLIAVETALDMRHGSPTYSARWAERARAWRARFLELDIATATTNYANRNDGRQDLRAAPPFPSTRL